MEPKIRFATADDINILAALGTTTCYEAYFELDPSCDLADYCARVYSPEQVRIEFEDSDSAYLIAEVNDRAVGFLKMRANNSVECLAGRNAIEVHRIYVLEKIKGHGIGKLLLDCSAEIAKERGFETLWLGVWDQNFPAQRFYEKQGMRAVGTTDFSDGKNIFLNIVYAKELN